VGVGRERRERGVFIAARCKRVQNRAVAIWRATRNEEQVTKWTENSFVCEERKNPIRNDSSKEICLTRLTAVTKIFWHR
jgi:hypothetical protein